MKIYPLIFLFFTCLGSSRGGDVDRITISRNGPSEVCIPSVLPKSTLYSRSLKWVHENYNNPEYVLTGIVENKSVSIRGVSQNGCYWESVWKNYCDVQYNLFITIEDSCVRFRISINEVSISRERYHISYFFKKNGEQKSMYQPIIPTLEKTLNDLLYSISDKLSVEELTTEEAIAELKVYKEKLDLQLISQEEYDVKKKFYTKFIK